MTLLQAEYDVPPILEWIGLNEIEVSQRHNVKRMPGIKGAGGRKQTDLSFAETCLAASGEYEISSSGLRERRRLSPATTALAERRSAGGTTEFAFAAYGPGVGETLLLLCYESAFSGSRFIGTGNGFLFRNMRLVSRGSAAGNGSVSRDPEESGEWLRWGAGRGFHRIEARSPLYL